MQMALSRTIPFDRLDRFIRLVLPVGLAGVWLWTAYGALTLYQQENIWGVGDWLINYQGGFVRRGLSGEAIYRVASGLGVGPGAVVAAVQIALYAVFYLFAYLSLRRQNNLLAYLLVLVSPAILSFQLHDPQGGYRKEILFFALMALMVWSATRPDPRKQEPVLLGCLAVFPLLILSHEMLAFWLPYPLAVYVYTFGLSRRRAIMLFAILSGSLLAFALSVYFHGDQDIVSAIRDSLAGTRFAQNRGLPVSSPQAGAIAWLAADPVHGKALVQAYILIRGYLVYYPQSAVLTLIAFVPLTRHFKQLATSRMVMFLVLSSILTSLMLFVVAADWGRFIYTHAVALFLLSLLVPSSPVHGSVRIWVAGITLVLVIGYAGLWFLPHSGNANPYLVLR